MYLLCFCTGRDVQYMRCSIHCMNSVISMGPGFLRCGVACPINTDQRNSKLFGPSLDRHSRDSGMQKEKIPNFKLMMVSMTCSI